MSMGGASAKGGGPMKLLKALDAYPKINDDFYTKTLAGGLITVLSTVVMVLLFLSELRLYARVNTVHELSVDTSRGETIRIHFDVTFPKMPCAWLSLDAMDISGDLHLDVDHDISKQRLSDKGMPVVDAEKHDPKGTKRVMFAHSENSSCMTCYGAEEDPGQCCNTCDEVRAAYRKKGWVLSNADHVEQCAHDDYLESIKEQKGEGCKMWGFIEVNKVAGNFHFAPGRSYQQGSMHVHDIAPFGDAHMDFTHTISKLNFGDPYPGMRNPLDGVHVKKAPSKGGASAASDTLGMYQYFLKVVPTVYLPLNSEHNSSISTNQFSVTENYRETPKGGAHMLPGVFFFYDLSPIKVRIVEAKSSFLHFVTSACAIVGGVFTVSGILDSFVYQGERLLRKKIDLGKQG